MNKTLIFLTRLIIINYIFIVLFLLYSNQKRQVKIVAKKDTKGIVVMPTPTIVQTTVPTLQINTSEPTPLPPTSPPDLFTQVGSHNSRSDCWMIISGHIYNITPFFGQHPGGDQTLEKYCGQDATLAYNTKDKSPGTPHSEAANSMLSAYLLQ